MKIVLSTHESPGEILDTALFYVFQYSLAVNRRPATEIILSVSGATEAKIFRLQFPVTHFLFLGVSS